MGATTIQPMPDLQPDEYNALRSDIAENGMIYPVVVDQDGRIIDGNNRARIADELGIEYPTEVRNVRNDDEAIDLAVRLNCQRRHLSREQVRQIIASEIVRRPDDSDRAIARRVGCDHKTVGSVRGGEIPQSTTMTLAEAEASIEKVRDLLPKVHDGMWWLVLLGLSTGVPPAEVVMALMTQKHDRAVQVDETIADMMFTPFLEYVLDPTMAHEWQNQDGAPLYEPLPTDTRAHLLSALSGRPTNSNEKAASATNADGQDSTDRNH